MRGFGVRTEHQTLASLACGAPRCALCPGYGLGRTRRRTTHVEQTRQARTRAEDPATTRTHRDVAQSQAARHRASARLDAARALVTTKPRNAGLRGEHGTSSVCVARMRRTEVRPMSGSWPYDLNQAAFFQAKKATSLTTPATPANSEFQNRSSSEHAHSFQGEFRMPR